MQKWLVTGGAGFIGSTFIRHLLATRDDVQVVNLDKLTYAGNPDNIKDFDPARHQHVRGDICDGEAVARAIAGCEVVVNFAAETHVDRSLLDAGGFVRTDVEGTWVLLEAARRSAVRRFVHISTDEVYGSRLEGSFCEQDVCNPRNPYAASKLGGDRLAYSYFSTYDVPVVIVRPSNNYGPRQHVEKMMPLFATNAILGLSLPVYGDGRNVRDWLYVEDNCRAIALLAEQGVVGEVYNVGGGNERENIDVTRRILDALGKPHSLMSYVKDRVGHDRRYSLASAKMEALGWKREMPFEQGLELTVRWYRDNEWWWAKLRDAEFKRYYAQQYDKRQG